LQLEKKENRKDYAFRRQFNEKPSIIPGCPGVCSYNGLPVGRIDNFKYLGLHVCASGDMSHLVAPLKAKAAGTLGCNAANAFSTAAWQHGQFKNPPVTKHPCAISALWLWIVGHA